MENSLKGWYIDRGQVTWNWQENVDYGVSFFLYTKAPMVLQNERAIINYAKKPPQEMNLPSVILPPLTSEQREDMTLECYGPHARTKVTEHYYFYQTDPNPDPKGKNKFIGTWIKNASGNPEVIEYVAKIRAYAAQN